MGEKVCLLRFSKEFARGNRIKGDRVRVVAHAALILDEQIINYFNIPLVKNTVFFQQTVGSYTQSRYQGLSDTTGTLCKIGLTKRTPRSNHGASKTIRLPHESLKTPKGKPKTFTLRFPWFFTNSMISQALGTMIQAHRPQKWFKANSGAGHLFMPAVSGLVPGSRDGAWIVAELGATANTGSSPVGPLTIVRSQTKYKSTLSTGE